MMKEQNVKNVFDKLNDSPHGMLGIRGVAGVLVGIFQRAWLIKPEPGDCRDGEAQLQALAPHLKELCVAIANGTEPSGRWVESVDAIRQFKTSHPVYACLYALSKAEPMSEERLNLVAHAVVASFCGLPGTGEYSDMPSANLQSAFRELRRLDDRTLSLVRFEVPSRNACYYALREVEHSDTAKIGAKERSQLGDIRRLIGLSLGLERPNEVKSGKQVAGTRGPRENEALNESVSPIHVGEELGESFSLMKGPVCDSSDLESARLDAMAPNDSAVEVSHALPTARANPKNGGSVQRSTFQARLLKDQMRRAAQALSSRWDRLSEADVGQVISMLSWQGAGQTPGSLAIGLLLLTGRPLSTVLNARLYRSIQEVPEQLSSDAMVVCQEGRFIQVCVPVPERMRPVAAEWQVCLRQAGNQVRLPIVSLIWSMLEEFLGSAKRDWRGYLFPRVDLGDIRANVKDALSGLRSEDGARVTDTRLRRTLFNQIADVQGDVVDAVFVTGNQPATGEHVGTHYYNVSEADLQSRYLEAAKGLLPSDELGLLEPVVGCPSRNVHIGSPFCPKREWLKNIVYSLRQSLEVARGTPVDAETLVDIHNRYTTYVLMFLAFATGHRSVKGPFSRITDYDPVSGMLVVADKTESSLGHARLEPVPEKFVDQIELYRRHRARVSERLWALLGIEEPAHFLFFLAKAAPRVKTSKKLVRVASVTPEKLKEHLGSFWDLPLNVNRHYLRSELRRKGVHAELVDAWMGHWLDGQEPMGRYSTLSPIDYAACIEPVITGILEELGFAAEEGLS